MLDFNSTHKYFEIDENNIVYNLVLSNGAKFVAHANMIPLPSNINYDVNGKLYDANSQTFSDAPITEADVREQRDNLLQTVVDPIAGNALRWGELSSEKQQEYTDYRRQLLDITEQSGFPTNVVWPDQPS